MTESKLRILPRDVLKFSRVVEVSKIKERRSFRQLRRILFRGDDETRKMQSRRSQEARSTREPNAGHCFKVGLSRQKRESRPYLICARVGRREFFRWTVQSVGLRRCDRWRRPLILERLLGYFVHDSSRPPLFFVIRFDYFLMANAIAKTAIAYTPPVNIMRDKKQGGGEGRGGRNGQTRRSALVIGRRR